MSCGCNKKSILTPEICEKLKKIVEKIKNIDTKEEKKKLKEEARKILNNIKNSERQQIEDNEKNIKRTSKEIDKILKKTTKSRKKVIENIVNKNIKDISKTKKAIDKTLEEVDETNRKYKQSIETFMALYETPKRKYKMNESLLKIGEEDAIGWEISYIDGPLQIFMLLVSGDNYLHIDELNANRGKKDRAPKGKARSILCQIVEYLIKNKWLTTKDKISLNPGELSGTVDFNIEKLENMYMSMGFKVKGFDDYYQTIGSFLNWCKEFEKTLK
jgi:hypothetical protein